MRSLYAHKWYIIPASLLLCIFSSLLTTDFLDIQKTIRMQQRGTNQDTQVKQMSTVNDKHHTATIPPNRRGQTRSRNASSSIFVMASAAAAASVPQETARSKATTTATRTSTTTYQTTNTTDSVIVWQGMSDLDAMINRYWKGNLFCEAMNGRNETDIRPTLLRITFGCEELFSKSALGTGNFISGFYGLRLAARTYQDVDVVLECPDAVQEQTNLILPWLMGSFPGGASQLASDQVQNTDEKNYTSVSIPTKQEACGNYDHCPIGHMLPIIRYELRRMAVALVGVPNPNHPSAAFAERYLWSNSNNATIFDSNTMQLKVPARGEPPLIPNVELDDVVLHFRCGDLMASNHPAFGFMKFSAFSKRISPEVTSIGIVTQPFGKTGQNRRGDATEAKRHRCRVVVTALVDFLAERFPDARITIHNGPNETIALAYARMVMANQTMAGITSFGVFPAVASFGTGYARSPDYRKAPNKWLAQDPPLEQVANNIVLMKEPNRLMAGVIKKMWQRENGQDLVLEWFQNDTFCDGLTCL